MLGLRRRPGFHFPEAERIRSEDSAYSKLYGVEQFDGRVIVRHRRK
jgi:hypothetical protein